MADQEHELWVDRNLQYSLEKFHEEMATKIIWGPSQTLAAWVLDIDSVDVVSKHGESVNASSGRRCVSDVTTGEGSGIHGNGGGRASNAAPENVEGTATDEDKVYKAIGFKVVDERAEEAAREAMPIPTMTFEMQKDMGESAILVDDNVLEEPMLAVRQHAIVKEFKLATAHSDTQRFRGHCGSLGCPWIIRARTQHDGSVRVQINEGIHNCASRARVLRKMASQSWVAERVIPLLKKKLSMGPKVVQEELQDKYKIEIPYQTVAYGRQRVANKLFGKWDDSFDWLYRFKAEVEMRSLGSILEIDTEIVDDKVHFKRFFCCFKATIDGFRNGCRPYISIDSIALNGLWNGHLPVAQALDGHNWMYPLAFGFFDSETKENWTWFMEQLSKSIGPMENLDVYTDACKGLEAAVAKVFSNSEQGECFRHLMENMKKYYLGDVYAKNMWPVARAYTPHKFKYFFDKVVDASPDVLNWLKEHHNLLWARSKFTTEIKCDYINNNLVESWNAWIKEHKDLHVHCLADAITEKTLTLFAKKRKIANAPSIGILPAVIHQLNAGSRGLGHLKVTKGHLEEAEVTEIYKDKEVRR
ncbi:uncharacterized protein [Miscanthus floridulus]|uniref:uncharacterized protein n=1 Tax=Miscanthus floridulus TaxID=154761 RepID=UPI00345975A5